MSLIQKERIIMIKYFFIDVDGTLTDGGIYYDEKGNELKKFSTKDAAGFFVARKANIRTAILTGRECSATKRRMTELKVDKVFQNVTNKEQFLYQFIKSNSLSENEIGYIGDDINDFLPMQLAKFKGCPLDSCKEITSIVDYISPIRGGYGAVRDIIEYYLRKENLWEKLAKDLYCIHAPGIGI
jgi:3-deoxy-D-manno-octulosonate 8-phosphate phosphatase (KDO 8-P phosphatase)